MGLERPVSRFPPRSVVGLAPRSPLKLGSYFKLRQGALSDRWQHGWLILRRRCAHWCVHSAGRYDGVQTSGNQELWVEPRVALLIMTTYA